MNIPEKWFFIGTKESQKENKCDGTYQYFLKKFKQNYGFFNDSRYYSDGQHNFTKNPIRKGFKEISFEEFKEYVLKEPSKIIEIW